MPKGLRRFLVVNWLPLTTGFILTALAIRHMYPIRGGAEFGSEFFITPLLVFLNMKYWQFKKELRRRRRRVR